MNENKKEFVEALSDALKMDSRSGVKSMRRNKMRIIIKDFRKGGII